MRHIEPFDYATDKEPLSTEFKHDNQCMCEWCMDKRDIKQNKGTLMKYRLYTNYGHLVKETSDIREVFGLLVTTPALVLCDENNKEITR